MMESGYWSAGTLRWDEPSYTFTVTPTNPHKDHEMKKKYDEAREDALTVLAVALKSAESIKVITTEDEEGILAYSDDGTDGGLVAIHVRVEVGSSVESLADRVMKDIAAERERRAEVFGDDE